MFSPYASVNHSCQGISESPHNLNSLHLKNHRYLLLSLNCKNSNNLTFHLKQNSLKITWCLIVNVNWILKTYQSDMGTNFHIQCCPLKFLHTRLFVFIYFFVYYANISKICDITSVFTCFFHFYSNLALLCNIILGNLLFTYISNDS